ncbi:glycosyltransferase [Streptomyces sp. MP131-18]|uniref:glycosyltransferase n=1 Tax=Streptomyces sp. MP131-18 TaxID=1857892 RepID=UPI00097C848E|nr:glycosyltransferase [Streptomyces sp. MP131-18]ONK12768.1 GDP-mannose-dependent alpha-(1-6)-phosphatidylinositol monomannoside mannosyltransferase [Streptomyces sp. MP131-18]
MGSDVLHLVQPADGGVARVVADLVRAQTAAGLRVVVGCPPGGPLAGAVGADVLPWEAERAPGRRLPAEVAGAARVVRRAAPRLVHLHSAKAGLAGRLALRGRLPTVYQPHAWSFEAVGGPAARLATAWERLAVRWTDRVLCVSEAERERGLGAGIDARWAVVPNGVDPGRHPVADGVARRQARAALAAVHALPQRAPLVVCVARLCRQKGQDLLLRAWPRVAARVPGARLALVGDGPQRAALRAAAGPGVLLAGHTDDPGPWYAAADVVVLPSRWEGMALAPLEAMATGRPVVLTDTGGARACLPPGHAPHCLVAPGDADGLARALAALLDDPARRRALGREAAAHARAAHDVRRSAAACALLYRELLTPHAAESTRELCRS